MNQLRLTTRVNMLFAGLIGCAADSVADPEAYLSEVELQDPETCKSCHPQHYREWASSMHAYAGDDPVFAAMNRRAQRATEGAIGDFCVKCHAPMAVYSGLTRDGLDLDRIPKKLRGVTCYVCHNVSAVGDHFNNGLQLANDNVMRAALDAPIRSSAHATAYSEFLDGNRRRSSELCGSCHDVVVPSGVHLERTFDEYKESLFGKLDHGFETCVGCHMPGRETPAVSLTNAPQRTTHEHLWPAVDVALTPFPDLELQRTAVECELALGTRFRSIEHDELGTFTVFSETSAGHRQPSGAAQDRRMWIEVIAYDGEENVIFESGRAADGEPIEKLASDARYDPQLALYRDWLYDANSKLTHNFWEAASSAVYPDGYESLTLPYAVDPGAPHTLSARFMIPRYRDIARMTVRMRLQPIGMDVLQDLVASGDLDQSVIERMPTFIMHGASIEWRPGGEMVRSLLPQDLGCRALR